MASDFVRNLSNTSTWPVVLGSGREGWALGMLNNTLYQEHSPLDPASAVWAYNTTDC